MLAYILYVVFAFHLHAVIKVIQLNTMH